MKIFFENKPKIIFVAAYLFCIYMVFRSVSWIPSTEGDGFMLPQAVNLAQGKTLYRDIHEQYGSLVPFMQFPFIKLFGSKIIVLRVVGFIVIVLIAIMAYVIISQISSRLIAKLSSIVILAAQPSWNVFSHTTRPIENIAWFNLYGLLFYLISLNSLIRIDKSSNKLFHVTLAAISSFIGFTSRLDLVLANIFLCGWVLLYSRFELKLKLVYLIITFLSYLIFIINKQSYEKSFC